MTSKFIQPFLLTVFVLISTQLCGADNIQILSLGLENRTARGSVMAGLFDKHLANIVSTVEGFVLIRDPSLMQQLSETGNRSDRSITEFASRAEIPVVVRGLVEDRGEYIQLRIYATCYDVPFNGSLAANHEIRIPILPTVSTRELSYIMEEHTGRFLVKLLDTYARPIRFSVPNGDLPDIQDGTYSLYRTAEKYGTVTAYDTAGRVAVSDSRVTASLPDGDYFLLVRYNREAESLRRFYYGRKHEIVFMPVTVEQRALAVLSTPVLSVVSPIGTPIAYYLTADYTGLGLWTLNNAPYLYTASRGFLNSPDSLRKSHADISRFDKASHYYSYYHFLCTGMALYADAIGNHASYEASNYVQAQPFTGDPGIALYLSLLGNGSGHFYKGYRGWGYLYFHADNLLLFSSLYYLSERESYSAGRYESTGNNTTAGYSLLALAAAVRIVEIFHSASLPFNIANGSEVHNRTEIVPEIHPDPSGSGMTFGISVHTKL
ncbi:MAG: hypothetical protein ACOC2H_03505 [Spirochaetota bacterium]